MRRNWIKLYVDQSLRGTMVSELSAPERWIWIGLLLMAGDSNLDGIIYLRKDKDRIPIGYSDGTISELLAVDVNTFQHAKKKLIEYEKISIDKHNTIIITNWNKYQSEYQRQRDYREEYKKRKDKKTKSVVTKRCNLSNNIDIDRELDKDKEKNILRKEKEKYLDYIFLTDEEHKKLLKKLGKSKTEDMIEKLNNYIGSKGKKYKSHYFTILSWYRNDPSKEPIKKTKFFRAEDDKGKYVAMPNKVKKKFEKALKKIEEKGKVFNG